MSALGTIFYYPQHEGLRDLVTIASDLKGGPFDHLFFTETYQEVFTCVAAAADAVGAGMTLGTSVSNVYFHHPYEMASAVANVANLTDGRFVLGLGAGHQEVNQEGLGVSMAKPVSHMRDHVEVLRACLNSGGEPIAVANDRFQVQGIPLPWGRKEAPQVPIVLGALGDPMVRLAAQAADGVVLSHAGVPRVREVRELLAGAEQPARIYAIINVIVAETRGRARDRIRPYVSRYTRFPYYRALYAKSGVHVENDGSISDDGLDTLTIAGPPSYVRDRIEEFREAGVDVPILSPAGALDPAGTSGLRRMYDEFATVLGG